MDRRTQAFLGIIAATGALLTACSGNEAPSVSETRAPDRSSTTTTTSPSSGSGAARKYIEALSSRDPETMQTALANTLPGSIAEMYARHIIAVVTAYRDGGQPVPESQATFSAGSGRVCDEGKTEGETCTEFADFVVDKKTKKLVEFTADGIRLDDRLVLGTGAAQSAQGASVRLVSAYHSVQSDRLFVVVEVKAGDKAIDVYAYGASYVGPDGRQVEAEQATGSDGLQAGATGTVVIAFPSQSPGGRMVFDISDPDYNTATVTLPIP